MSLFALLVKVTLVLAAGAVLAVVLRRRAAAARHQVWAMTLLAALAMAPLVLLAPSIPLPLLDESGPREEAAAPTPLRLVAPVEETAPEIHTLAPQRSASVELASPPRPWSVPALLLALWALGTALVVGRAAVGQWALRRLARRATPLDSGDWPALLDETRALAGARRPLRLLRSVDVGTPLTWGTVRPVVLVPAGAESWPREQRRAALLHELAHVVRRDALVQLAGTGACALYWFHPGMWMALSRLRREGEQACDDRVLASGTPAGEYAAQLLEVARNARALRLGGVPLAIGMARPSTLEGRLLAVLDEAAPRRAPARAVRLAAAFSVAAVIVPLAGLTAVAQPASLVAAFPGASASPGCRTEGGDSFECAIEARSGDTLELDLETGASVLIRGWDEPRVQLKGRLKSDNLSAMHAEMTRASGGVRLRSWYTGSRGSWSSSHAFELQVPRRYDVKIESSGGDLTIQGVEGTFAGSSGGGDLVLEDLRGRADLSTGGGTIRVTDAHLEGSVSTGGGMVTLSRVSGGLRGSSGSGPVVYAEPDSAGGPTGDIEDVRIEQSENRIEVGKERVRRLHVERAGGDIRLDEAPAGAVLATGGGEIVVGRAGGSVEASTGGGGIRIGPVAGSVRAGTGAGDVEVTLIDAGGEPQKVEVRSGNGRIVIEVPADFEGRVELETAYTKDVEPTRIEAPWQLERSTSEWSDREGMGEGTPRRYVRAKGTVGGGHGLLRVKTVNGDVIVRASSGARSFVRW